MELATTSNNSVEFFENILKNNLGENNYKLNYYEKDNIYEVTINNSNRTYEVDENGNVKYLGIYQELVNNIIISATPESSNENKLIQKAEITISTGLSIKDENITLLYAWTTSNNENPVDSQYKVVTDLNGSTKIRKTIVYSDATEENNYYLWVKAIANNVTLSKTFGNYQIKDHTVLMQSPSEAFSGQNTSVFLGMDIERSKISEINILSTKEHIADGEKYFDVTESQNGKFVAYYEEDENGYFTVSIEGDGGITANPDSSALFAFIGKSVSGKDVVLNGSEYIDTGLIINMQRMFMYSGFKSLNLSSWDVSNVENMGNQWDWTGVFVGCSKLENLNLSNWNTSKVTRIGSMFVNCSSLKELDLSSFNTSKVIDMGELFNNCNSLTKLNLQNFDMTNVTNIFRFITTSTSNLKIITNKSMYNWFNRNYSNYLNCIEIVESINSNLN